MHFGKIIILLTSIFCFYFAVLILGLEREKERVGGGLIIFNEHENYLV